MINVTDRRELLEQLREIKSRNSKVDWLKGLNGRKKAELEFHDQVRAPGAASAPADTFEALHGNKKYYAVVRDSQSYVERWLAEHLPGKVFLDYACGNGQNTVKAAKLGAEIAIGLEISPVSIRNAERAAETENLSDRCVFIQGDCENTGLPDASIDVIVCSGMLHHLDLSYAFPELRRILKPGGLILAIEALDYNPAIKAYRLLTPSMRTAWETLHILSLADLRFASRFFTLEEVRYWHLFAIGAVAFRGFPRLFEVVLRALNAMDALAMRLPFVRLLAWQITFVMRKPADD